MHPILDSLTGTQFEVVRNLLFAFNAGDIARFESLIPEIASTEVSPSTVPLLILTCSSSAFECSLSFNNISHS